ncbi:MAG: ArsR family transcriptional regulator [Promethearchaeota archaeon]|nr:MAG: ArsR family transcriptional regulator [Candidatus Lokiarchaeota archaeon]
MDEARELLKEGKLFEALPRLTIMLLLYLHRKVGVSDLRKLLQLSPGNLDHHIRKLEDVGYVKTRQVFSWRPLVVVEITQDGTDAFREYALKLRTLLDTIK